jgi:hypothetical protein
MSLSPEMEVTKIILTKVRDFCQLANPNVEFPEILDFLVPISVPMDFYPTAETGWAS